MKRLTVGGNLRFLAVCEAKRLSIPSALSATETSKSTNGRISS
jgi:hypothetical protein